MKLSENALAEIAALERRLHEMTGMVVELNPVVKADSLTLDDITRIACSVWGVSIEKFMQQAAGRIRRFVIIRQTIYAEAYPMQGSYKVIGQHFGKVCHSTVINGITKAHNDYRYDCVYRAKVDEVRRLMEVERLSRCEAVQRLRAPLVAPQGTDRRDHSYVH